jgi:hypothetical protein
LDKAWLHYNQAITLWEDFKYEFAMRYYARAYEKVNDALM